MLKDTLMSIWASVHDGWFTTVILFLLLNLIIGTIFFSSSSSSLRSSPSQKENIREEDPYFNLFCSSSVIERLRSVNLYLDHQLDRSKSSVKVAEGGEQLEKPPEKMKKAFMSTGESSLTLFAQEEGTGGTQRRRKAVRGRRESDEEVDAKADDFISRFKQQLKLQRLDSIMRYKEMLSRGR